MNDVIISYRYWRLYIDKLWAYPYLSSVQTLIRWPFKERLEAVDNPLYNLNMCHFHIPPGIYSLKSLTNTKKGGYLPISGEVKIWGEVHEHKNGYRSQFAYPKSITIHCVMCNKNLNNTQDRGFTIGDSILAYYCSSCIPDFLRHLGASSSYRNYALTSRDCLSYLEELYGL